ncbi:MAG: 2-phospho-L-lactate guanylyltransferase [Nocardioides sp.]
MSAPDPGTSFVALIPVKPPHLGKRRLGSMAPAFRTALASAFALDTMTAVSECALVDQVVLVTTDPGLAARAGRSGLSVLPDPPADDLNAMLVSVVESLDMAARRAILVTPADLPAMTPEDLAQTLSLWDEGGPAFVADAQGTGTTLYLARAADFAPRYGPTSRADHLAAGAVELPVYLSTVQHDVDQIADLDAAVGLGLGRHTRAVLAQTGIGR